MHGERFDASLGLSERFPRTTDISDGAVPEMTSTEKGASINVNSLTYPIIMHRMFDFGTEASLVRRPCSSVSTIGRSDAFDSAHGARSIALHPLFHPTLGTAVKRPLR
jgi:hypothetical protein